MDRGRAVVGASTIGALLLAAGLVIELVPAPGLTTDITAATACAHLGEEPSSVSAWFLTQFDNDTDHGIRVLSVRPGAVEGVRLEDFAIAPHPTTTDPGLVATDDGARPPEYGPAVPVDAGFTVPAHGTLNVVGHVVSGTGDGTGQVRDIVVTAEDRLGRLQSVTQHAAFGLGPGSDGSVMTFSCDGT